MMTHESILKASFLNEIKSRKIHKVTIGSSIKTHFNPLEILFYLDTLG
jgi:hypothetical protein